MDKDFKDMTTEEVREVIRKMWEFKRDNPERDIVVGVRGCSTHEWIPLLKDCGRTECPSCTMFRESWKRAEAEYMKDKKVNFVMSKQFVNHLQKNREKKDKS